MQPFRLTLAQKICRKLPPLIAQRARELIYSRALAIRDDFEFVVRAQTGSMLKNRTSDFHGYPFSVHGYYDWRRWAIALAVCSKGDTIFEIGSNIGTETVGFADIVGQSGQVYAFEPLPSNLVELTETTGMIPFHNVRILPFAVGDRCEKVRFAMPPKEMSGIGRVLWDSNAQPDEIEVDCLTLDSLLGEIKRVKIIFIDAEGAEVKILRGAEKLIAGQNPMIVLEANSKALAQAGASLTDLFLKISSFNYEVFDISRLRLVRIQPGHNFQSEGNWFCAHRATLNVVRAVNRSILACALLPCLRGLNPLTAKGHVSLAALTGNISGVHEIQ